ncbi:MAG: DUF5684 domain-containing protein [Bacteroidia bacterium]
MLKKLYTVSFLSLFLGTMPALQAAASSQLIVNQSAKAVVIDPFTLGILILCGLISYILGSVILAKVFKKGGEEGWKALVPIYNFLPLLRIAGKSPWTLLALLIPIVNIPFIFTTAMGISKRFGKSDAFTLGLVFLFPIFYAILAWGKTKEG